MSDDAGSELAAKRLRCPCGELIEGKDEDELVERTNAHLAEQHPHLAGHYSRDEILFMAY